jgi:large subunit ribosomal protein L16
MFTPKKTKYTKQQKGRNIDKIVKTNLQHTNKPNTLYLRALSSGRISSSQITSCRQTISKIIKKNGQLTVHAFAHTPITKKPIEIRMGKGKGSINHWVYKAKAGSILFEINISTKILGIKALELIQNKLPINTKII